MDTEVIYVLTNEAMPGYVKIGKTNKLKKRLSDLDNTSVPLPFQCVFAIEVSTETNAERHVHNAFDDNRVRRNREFFEIDPERVISALRLTGGKEINLDDSSELDSDTKQAIEKTIKRRDRFSFKMVDISEGEYLQFTRDESITCQVLGNNKILFDGKEESLTSAALQIINANGYQWKSVQGPSCWSYQGETLHQRRLRFETE